MAWSSAVKLRVPIPNSLAALLRRCSSSAAGETGFGKQIENDEPFAPAPPNPIPNRPLRRERPFQSRSAAPPPPLPPPPRASHFPQNHNNAQPRTRTDRDVNSNRDDHISDAAFLDRFKLQPDGGDPQTHSPTTAAAPPPPKEGGGDETHRNPTNSDHSHHPQSPPPEADEIFRKMKETGLIPNAVAMLDGLCKDGLVQDAMKLFAQMREKGTMPDVVIYTAVVDGFCKAQKLEDAKRIFRKMISNGINPNAFSYTVLIQGLYKCAQLDDAVEFCCEMLEAGHSPNVTTFVGLVDAMCRHKGMEEARGVIKSLREKGMYLNDKAVREFLDKNAPLSSALWEAFFGKKPTQNLF
ncbi:unnamed protein product [Linum tenue]|uniref:Pentatricopeptide repeat-containing protein n=1 Tax=Linum tenue TaxID=586396 RepID=A0AAV0L016_9ROSI|nr:unnamed protein product [Linum tenue]